VGTPSFTAGATSLCAGATSTYTATAANSSSVTYSILGNTGATIDANTGAVSNVTGNFTVVATASGACGANTTANRAVTVNGNVGTPSFTAGATSLCAGGTSTYTATAANSSSVTYSILGNTGATIDANTGVVSSVTGNFTVVATASGSCGANTTANRAVTVNGNVGTPSFTAGATSLCAGATSTYTATAANSSSVTYSILGNTGATIDANTGVVSNVTGNFTVVATASGSCGANTTANRAVTVNPSVGTPSFTAGATSLCAGATSTYTATAANSSSVTYSILGNTGATIDANTGVVSNVTGNFTVVATASGSCGANTTANRAVTVNGNVGTPSFTAGATAVCIGSSPTYTATAANSSSITYSILNNTGATINPTSGVVGNITGPFTVVATASGSCGANTTANRAVSIGGPVGTPTFTAGASALCAGQVSTYTATATNAASISYSIIGSGATINPTTGEVSNVTSSFFVRASATGICGGTLSADFSVTVVGIMGTASFTAGPLTICEGTVATYTVTAANATSIVYSILQGGGATINASNGVVGNVTGNFTVRATVSNPCSPTVTVDRSVTVQYNVGTPVFTSAPTPICAGQPVTFTATAVNASSITYSTMLNTPVIDINTGVVTNPTGNFTVVAKATGVCGTPKSTSKPITVNKSPSFTVVNPAAVIVPATVNITNTASPAVITNGTFMGTTPVITYWTNSTTTNALTTPTAVATSGTYYIKVTNNFNCSTTKPVVVTINPSRLMMNTTEGTSIYPNPAQEQVHIKTSYIGNATIKISDILGKTISETNTKLEEESIISLEGLQQGAYFIHIFDENGNPLHSDKIVKE